MVPFTRRRLLHVAVAGLGGLAGCNQLTGSSAQSSRSVDENSGLSENAANSATDPPTVLLRADAEIPPIRSPNFEREGDGSERDRLTYRTQNLVISSQSKADGLTADDEETVSEFVSQTDFDNETLFLETNLVQECYRLHLCQIAWQPDRIETDYARQLRPYDEYCAVDNPVFESRLIRLPVSLDADAIDSFASSISGGECDSPGISAEGSGSSSESTTGSSNGGAQQ